MESGLTIERVGLDELDQDPANARSHGPENMEAIVASLRRFGQAEPLVVQASSGRVIGGNGRLTAMTKLGWEECDVVRVDVDDVEAAALGIALNRTADLAAWDDDALARILSALRDADALDGVGYSPDDVATLLAATEEHGRDVDDPGPEALPEEPVSRPGDLWLLADHRVLCGDARRHEAVQLVLDGHRADLVWTDPPYGVAYVGKTEDALEIQNDDLDGEELETFLRETLGNAADATKPGGVWYVAAPAGPNFLPFATVLTELGIWRQTLVWLKDVFVLGRSDFHYKHEAILYGWRPGAAHHEPSDRKQDTVWEVARPKASRDHPTSKPVALVQRAIETSSPSKSLVFDPFLGSGSTLIAAEASGRRCSGLELDPRYVDVIVRRWEQASGGEAELAATGQAFSDVAEERGGEE